MLELDETGARVLSLLPVAVGSRIALRFRPPDEPATSWVDAHVVSCTMDPRNPLACGFEVVFPELSDAQLREIGRGLTSGVRQERPAPERRRQPRINTLLQAAVIHEAGQLAGALVTNLSLSGARVALNGAAAPRWLATGERVALEPRTDDDQLVLHAHVVRTDGWQSVTSCGVRFDALSVPELLKLERILRLALARMLVSE